MVQCDGIQGIKEPQGRSGSKLSPAAARPGLIIPGIGATVGVSDAGRVRNNS